ncbi:MAG: hypothetical protein U0U66_11805 [Cytophagaceae bacterium]
MRKLRFLLCATLLPFLCQAQFPERTNETYQYNVGARPVKGYKALTFSFDPLNVIGSDDAFFTKIGLTDGSLFNAKYFISDNVAIRGGFRLYKEGSRSTGDVDVTLTGGTISARELKEAKNEFILIPGIERHFGYSNIFDVYVAGEMMMGLGRNIRVENTDYTNGFHDYETRISPKKMFGLGAVAGVNVFILDLPISVGIEYGLHSMYTFGDKTKVDYDVNDATGQSSGTYFVQEKDPFGNADPNSYSNLKASSSYINTASNFRVNINIYFK